MKKILFSAVAILLSISAFAQNGKSIYQKYSDEPGVEAVYVSPAMFKMIGGLPMSTEDIEIGPIIRTLTGFYLLSTGNQDVAGRLNADVSRFISSGKYELLVETKSDGEILKIYTVSQDKYTTSLVLSVKEGNSATFICIDGQILTSDLEKLIAGMQ